MMHHFRVRRVLASSATIWLGCASAAVASPVLFSAAGPNPAAIQAEVTAFTAALGTNNGVGPCAGCTTGFRGINWDGVPDTASTPNPFPGDFFNQPGAGGRVRGLTVTTPGDGFTNSATAASGIGVNFVDRNPAYAGEFQTFSPERLFSSVGSTFTDVFFSVAGTPDVSALTRGFGVVFADVDVASSTSLDFFGSDDTLLYSASASPYDKGLSFLGVVFDDASVARVRITSGTALLGQADQFDADVWRDAVVMDDFFYGEPQAKAVPEPVTGLLVGVALLAGAPWLRRRRT